MKFYEIEQSILDCVDLETGEIIDLEKLKALNIERDTKIDNIATWYKTLVAEAEAIKVEEKNLAERRKVNENKAKSIKGFLNTLLAGNKFETARNKISFTKSSSLEVVNESLVPKEFKQETITISIDKNAIKKAIKEGEIVAGVALIANSNIQIK